MKRGLLFLLILMIAVATPVLPAGKGDAAAGKTVYAKRCAACHGANGKGNPAIAKSLKVELRPLGSKEVQAKSDDQLKKESSDGTGKMKPVKGMSEKELDDIVAFMRSLAKK